jgi:hypothetical protein
MENNVPTKCQEPVSFHTTPRPCGKALPCSVHLSTSADPTPVFEHIEPENIQLQSWGELEDRVMPFDPEWVGRAPKTIYAIKYLAQETSGKSRTYIFLLGSKEAYDQRIAGPEKGQGLRGTVTWEAITPAVKRNKPPQEESLF